MSQTEKRQLRRDRCNAKYAARSFAEGVRAAESGHNGHSGVAYRVGGELVNVPAKRASLSLWRPQKASGPDQSESKASARRDAFELMFAD